MTGVHRAIGWGWPSRWERLLPVAVIAGAVAALGSWNASTYPATMSYDGAANLSYADGILHGRLPAHTGEFHNPPGFYALAAIVDRLGHALSGLGDPHRVMQAVNVALFVATAVLVWRIVLELWPTRPRRALVAMAFVVFVPVAERAAVAFHPELLDLFLSTLAIWLSVRLLRRATVALAVAIGVTLGLAQLVRAFSIAVLVAIVVALLVARRAREAVLIALISILIAAPWYVRQSVVYGTPFPFNRPAPHTAIWDRRPLEFYVGLGLRQLATQPYRGHFVNQLLPTTYSELWGDYFGHWAWNGSKQITGAARHQLRFQMFAGLLPTLLAIGGWFALLATARRRPAQLLVALVPLVGLGEYVFFTVSYPSPDGDVLKATYLLATAVGWAAGFAYALARLPRSVLLVVVPLLAAAGIAELPFLVYR